MPTNPLRPLVVDDLHHTRPDRPDRPALDGVGFTVAPGQRLGLIGENGSGKSTLLRLVAAARPDAGYLAQDSGLDPEHTVAQTLRAALAPLHDLVARVEQRRERLVDGLLAAVGDQHLGRFHRVAGVPTCLRGDRLLQLG